MQKILVLIMIACLFGCNDETENPTNTQPSDQIIIQDQEKYNDITEAIYHHPSTVTDPFKLKDAWIDEWELKAIVFYSGGCKKHEFQLVWPEVITMIYPPTFDIYLLHEGNEDLCEAYPTDTLVFDLSNNDFVKDLETLHSMQLGLVNGSNPEEVIYPNE